MWGYYFESDDSVHRRASDLLMLVQGWRRYDWEELSGYRPRSPEEWYPVEDMLYITGHLRSVKKSLPVDGIPIKVYVYSGGSYTDGEMLTDERGPLCLFRFRTYGGSGTFSSRLV